MSRLLGVDLGERRVGLAIADTESGRARPLATIRRGRAAEADSEAIRRVLGPLEVAELVVGLPLDMRTGDAGPQARASREWGEAIAVLLAIPVAFRDERLTSHVAEQRLGPMPRGRSGGPPTPRQRDAHRARVDREAAAVILQDELDARLAAGGARPGAATGLPTSDSGQLDETDERERP